MRGDKEEEENGTTRQRRIGNFSLENPTKSFHWTMKDFKDKKISV